MTFLRRNTPNYKRLGSHARKKQKWRRARGRHNKIRECKKGKPVKIQIGFRTERTGRGKINGRQISYVRNLKQAENLIEGSSVIINKIGEKKRKMIMEKLKEKKAVILNLRRKK